MENIEKLFGMLNEHAEKIEKEQDITLLEGVLDGLEAWLDGVVDFSQEGATKEDVRKAVQIAILKGMRKGSQPNHQMTPDTLGLLVGYFVEQIFADRLATEKNRYVGSSGWYRKFTTNSYEFIRWKDRSYWYRD